MLGPQQVLFEIACAPLLAVIQPTNPSSLTLAVMAIIFGTSFHLLVRPGYGQRPLLRTAIRIEPQEEGSLIRPRRVA